MGVNHNKPYPSADAILQKYVDEYLPEFSGYEHLDINQIGIFGNTPLHVACVRGLLDEVLSLLLGGADIHKKGELEYTPLHSAVSHGHFDIAKELLERGAKVSDKTEGGFTSLDIALMQKNERMMELLKSHS